MLYSKGRTAVGMGRHPNLYYSLLALTVVATLYMVTKTVLAVINIPVTVGMEGHLVERTDTTATFEVEGFKIRDCKLDPDAFASWYSFDQGNVHEGGKVTFPFDRMENNSRPRGLLNQYNFGLFKLLGIPADAKFAMVSSEHWCVVDGVRVKVTSMSGGWGLTHDPDHAKLRNYSASFENFGAFNPFKERD